MFNQMSSTCATTSGACHRPAEFPQNVGEVERWASLATGVGLLLGGLSRRLPGGLLVPLAGAALIHRGWTGRCSVYGMLGVDTSENGHERRDPRGVQALRGQRVEQSIFIRRSASDLYDFWRQIENLPQVMRHLERVTPTGSGRSHWVARGPMGVTLDWDAEVINEKPGEMIAWESLPGSSVDTAGSVRFVPSDSGESTELIVSIKYDPPGGRFVARLADFLNQGLAADLKEDLAAFKQRMETASAKSTSTSSVARE